MGKPADQQALIYSASSNNWYRGSAGENSNAANVLNIAVYAMVSTPPA